MSPDVIVNLYGGLGNQLFQYAAGLTALRAVGGSTISFIHVEGHRSQHAPDLRDLIDVEHAPPTLAERARWVEMASLPGRGRSLLARSARVHERWTKRVLVKHADAFLGMDPLPRGAQVKLEGYFQNPEWYANTWMQVTDVLLRRAPAWYGDAVQERAAVVHVRGGDYKALGWALGPEYYERVLSAWSAAGVRRATIVTDDPAIVPWLGLIAERRGIEVVKGPRGSAIDDFWTLAAAGRIAIANSTFSWWAAAVATARSNPADVWAPEPWLPLRSGDGSLPSLRLNTWRQEPSGFV